MIDKLFTQSRILGKALEGTTVRNEVLIGNIANADTPGYKRKDIKFDEAFQQAVYSNRSGGYGADVRSVTPSVQVENPNFNYRLDENNVDIDREMTELYKNSLKHDVVTQSLLSNSKRKALVYTMR